MLVWNRKVHESNVDYLLKKYEYRLSKNEIKFDELPFVNEKNPSMFEVKAHPGMNHYANTFCHNQNPPELNQQLELMKNMHQNPFQYSISTTNNPNVMPNGNVHPHGGPLPAFAMAQAHGGQVYVGAGGPHPQYQAQSQMTNSGHHGPAHAHGHERHPHGHHVHGHGHGSDLGLKFWASFVRKSTILWFLCVQI